MCGRWNGGNRLFRNILMIKNIKSAIWRFFNYICVIFSIKQTFLIKETTAVMVKEK